MNKISHKDIETLAEIYEALSGVMSEYDAFDGFYKGGSEKMMNDFTDVLKNVGIKFVF